MKPQRRELIRRKLLDGAYRQIEPDAAGLLRSHVFPGLCLNPELFWDSDLPAIVAMVQQDIGTPAHSGFVRQLANRWPY